eukprot:GHVU01167887.1.p2 GENE.GHVU01167887.1~~GHVU01167887.1.p2  ORF type:complete len:133 (+),score=11.24 GHVU01167887.1:430-828(+)
MTGIVGSTTTTMGVTGGTTGARNCRSKASAKTAENEDVDVRLRQRDIKWMVEKPCVSVDPRERERERERGRSSSLEPTRSMTDRSIDPSIHRTTNEVSCMQPKGHSQPGCMHVPHALTPLPTQCYYNINTHE